ncbi:hypothetical protein DFQ30_005327, partial [Apophysomyces sp. BC1015]
SFIDESIPQSVIINVFDPILNGNCGFRVLAQAITSTEDKWASIKAEMLTNFEKLRTSLYQQLSMEQDKVQGILLNRESPCSSEFYMDTIDCIQITAKTFGISIAIYSASGKA